METAVPTAVISATAQPTTVTNVVLPQEVYALMLGVGWILAIFVAALGLLVLWKILTDKIKLDGLLDEPAALGQPAKASLARFQFLVFTFVIAMTLFLVIISKGPGFPETIPGEIFALLGISGGSFLVSKGITSNDKQNTLQANLKIEEQKTLQTAIQNKVDQNTLNQMLLK